MHVPSHPDRAATTLATVERERAARGPGPFAKPAPGARDCRIDLKILAWHAERAIAQHRAAGERLQAFAVAAHPDLWAGTVRDGTARGFAAALEEAIAIAHVGGEPEAPEVHEPADRQVFAGKELRRKKDLLVKSGGARIRFSRRDGLLFVDRDGDLNSPNCLRFEARRDLGTLDAFQGDDSERPRLFSAQFLKPTHYITAKGYSELLLAGRLGRGPIGWRTQLRITGSESESSLALELRLDNTMTDWRLRARFLGVPSDRIRHECADVREAVANDAGGFIAFTLVRACGRLLIDGLPIEVPGAQCHGQIVHRFRLGPE